MVECTGTGNLRGVCQRLKQTGKSDHYGPWHCQDSAPLMAPFFLDWRKHKKKVLNCCHCIACHDTVHSVTGQEREWRGERFHLEHT